MEPTDDYKGINLYGNPLESPPIEIVKRGREAVVNYFRAMEAAKETISLYEAKLLIVGRGEVGKTCLMNKIMNPGFKVKQNEETTEGVAIKKWPLRITRNNKEINFTVHFWDFGGQEIYHATHQFFLTKRSLYLFVWDARKEEDYQAFDYWLNVIKLLSDASPTIMAMNKSDMRVKEIDQKTIQQKFPNVKSFHQVSALKDTGIQELRRDILLFVNQLPHMGDQLPKEWQDIRLELEKLKANYISYQEFQKLCAKYKMDKSRAAYLSEYFHDLGVFLHFRNDELLNEIVILKPDWATNAVYKILDDAKVTARKGQFTFADLKRAWGNAYPEEKYPHLLRMMLKFELCFRIGETDDYVAPELMPAEHPGYNLKKKEQEPALHFQYQYDFMPAGIITRFIVRQHVNIFEGIFWKNGALLRYGNSVAEIIADPMNRRIKIKIEGGDKKRALNTIRREIDHIHETLNRPDVAEMLPCNCDVCAQSETPRLFSYRELLKYQEAGEKEIVCSEGRIKRVRVEGLLHGFKAKLTGKQWNVFLSYATEDRARIKTIVSMLQKLYIDYWLDDEQINPGDSISQKIEHGLLNSAYVMPCISRNQLNSGWCERISDKDGYLKLLRLLRNA